MAAPTAGTWGGVPDAPPQVPLSLLEHHTYCPRQAALIALEDAYTDDVATIRGTLQHQHVHEPGHETRPGLRVLRALPVWNDEIGLTGVCDVVELHDDGTVVPVEHKSGRHRPGGPADVQLAAQAICLEEMFHTSVPAGAIYSGADKRRHRVAVDQALRDRVRATAEAVRNMLATEHMPAPPADARCPRCSMYLGCMPHLLADQRAYHTAAVRLFQRPPED